MFKKILLLLLISASSQLLSMDDGGQPAKKQKVNSGYDREQIAELVRLVKQKPSLTPEEIRAGMNKFNREHGKY